MATGKLTETGVRVWDEEEAEKIYSEKYYGKFADDDALDLSIVEAFHLVERDMLEVREDGEVLDRDELFERCQELDKEFAQKYAAYSDLRERGYIVKTGFKFGAHFRVYPRGVNPYVEGEKSGREHTKWVVQAVPESQDLSYQEMSRAVRLAQNIRATILWGVVDSEQNVTYYEVNRITP